MSFKIFVGFFVAAGLISCASDRVRQDGFDGGRPAAPESGRPAAVVDHESNLERPTKKTSVSHPEPGESGALSGSAASGETPPSESSKKAQQLNEAIRIQSDQEIFNASSQILFDSPNHLKALNAMALFNYKKGRFLAAEYLLRRAIADHSNSGEVHSNLGIVYLAQKKDREAIQEFRKALEINSEDAVASANLGSIYVMQKDYTKAQIVLENVYRKGWKDSKALTNYAIALAAGGKFEKSEEIYKTIIKEQNSNKEVLFNYAILQIEHLSKFEEGLETINRLKFIGPPGDFRKRLAALEAKAKAGK